MIKTIVVGVALAISASLLGGCSAGVAGGTMLPASQSAATRSMNSAGGSLIVRPHFLGVKPNDSTGGPIKPNDSTGGPIKPNDSTGGPIKPNDSTGGPIKPNDSTGGPIKPNDSTGGPIKPNDSTGGPIKFGAKKRMKPADSTGGPIVGKHH